MFDLTSNVNLDKLSYKKYTIGRIVLHLFFLVFVLFVADRVLLPSAIYTYVFNATASTKNTIINPHLNSQVTVPSNGEIKPSDNLTFNAISEGIFSKATVTLTTDKKNQNLENSKISIRKSYLSFFYPVGTPIGFKDGTLLSNNNDYYIVSGGQLRRFQNVSILNELGYNISSFLKVLPNDLQYNKKGDEIASITYPDDTLFKIDGKYYQYKNQQLLPFLSEKAFLTRYNDSQAIVKNNTFLASFPVSQTQIGFADGTLVSSNISVYILSDGKSYPIANPQTFESMGFHWNDVIAIGSDELALYEQQKQFNINDPHPNGTLFLDKKTNQLSIIDNGQRRPILSQAIEKTFSKQDPIVADSSTLDNQVFCTLKKIDNTTYQCNENLESIRQNIGNNYQFDAKFNTDAKISSINTTFSSSVTWENIRTSLSGIKGRIMSNYGITTPTPNQ